VTERVTYARELVADGHRPAVVARILQISRQAIYRIPKRTPPAGGPRSAPPADEAEAAIVEVAQDNPTDGYRMVTAWVRRRLGQPVNRKKVLRVMRQRKLIQRASREPRAAAAPARVLQGRAPRPALASGHDLDLGRRARLGLSERDHRLLHPRDRRLGLDTRCRAAEANAVIEQAVADQGIRPGTLKLGTDNGSAFTAKATRLVLSGLGVRRRRGG